MEFEEFRDRVQAERSKRAQRDAAESGIPGERLRREIREAFEREDARKVAEDRGSGVEPNPRDAPDSSGQ